MLDIDRLAANAVAISEHNPLPRGSGKTTTYLALMMGEAELGSFSNTYLYVAPTSAAANYVCKCFAQQVTQAFGPYVIELNLSNKVRLTNNQLYMFVGAPNAACIARGLTIHAAYLDVDVASNEDVFTGLYPHIACGASLYYPTSII